MGHESPIELWSPNLTTFCFVGFGTDRLRRKKAMKTADRENPDRWANVSSNRVPWCGWSEQILLHHVGWEARKITAGGDVFLLDFYIYRTYQDFATLNFSEVDFWTATEIDLQPIAARSTGRIASEDAATRIAIAAWANSPEWNLRRISIICTRWAEMLHELCLCNKNLSDSVSKTQVAIETRSCVACCHRLVRRRAGRSAERSWR